MDDDELVNELHGLLSHEVLFVYVRWMVYGRLVQVTPPSASLESLMSRAQASAYRLPLLAFAAACSDLWRDRKSVQGTDSPVWLATIVVWPRTHLGRDTGQLLQPVARLGEGGDGSGGC